MRSIQLLTLTLLFFTCHALPTDSVPRNLPNQKSRITNVVKDSYIVVLKNGVKNEVNVAATPGVNSIAWAKAQKRYHIGSFQGYAGKYDRKTVEKLKLAPEVKYVVPNNYVSTAALGTAIIDTPTSNWNLHRISHREPLSSGLTQYYYRTSSAYREKECSSDIYIIDTGIKIDHSEFEGRASFGINTVGGANTDGNGHGTHVAGIVAGRTFGVEPKASLIAVKALDDDGYGSFASVIEGVEWVVKQVVEKKRQGVSIINMSLIGSSNQAMNDAVEAAFKAGIVVTVAAGNYGELAVYYSPAAAQDALTIAATNKLDQQTSWSNYGIVIDHQAPGEGIRSAWITSSNSTAVLSGTSMASPHVAGLASYLMCTEGIRIPRIIKEKLIQYSSQGIVKNVGNTTPNRLVFNGVLPPP